MELSREQSRKLLSMSGSRLLPGLTSLLLFPVVVLLYGCWFIACNNNQQQFYVAALTTTTPEVYQANWNSLDSRPLPLWYRRAKFGILIHWGVFSVPSYQPTGSGEWFWYNWKGLNNTDSVEFVKDNYKPGFQYQDFARDFTAELFRPDEWARLFGEAGAKYVVLTSKHHDGFCLWPSKGSWNWNAMDTGPHRDLVGELRSAILRWNEESATSAGNTDMFPRSSVKLSDLFSDTSNSNGSGRSTDTSNTCPRNIYNPSQPHEIKFGLYHSLYEWFNHYYLHDKHNNFNTKFFPTIKVLPELRDLIQRYQPSILWSYSHWEAPAEYWQSQQFLADLYNSSPVKDEIVTNDRWGRGTDCQHGGVFNCYNRYNPGTLQNHYWENCLSLDRKSWGFRRDAADTDYMGAGEVLMQLVSTVATGGNVLLNVGPTASGTIPAVFQTVLRQLGEWLGVNGRAIYDTDVYTPTQQEQFCSGSRTLSENKCHENQCEASGGSGDDCHVVRVYYTSKCASPNQPAIEQPCSGDGYNRAFVYATFLSWPEDGVLRLRTLPKVPVEALLIKGKGGQQSESLKVTGGTEGMAVVIELPAKPKDSPSWWAGTVRLRMDAGEGVDATTGC
eukprot:GHVQ01043540.1.p1 GENE.GHVQ01043540.1~~GHVQ01043540.1.p1  ORF type:complete len:614 (-),score=66.18 GHVQ01043540.1:305-2146(-)